MQGASKPIVRLDSPPDNICIFRLSALGDAVHVVPVVRSLQKAWPNTKITWIIGTLEHKLLSGIEGIEFIVFNKRGGSAAVSQLKQQLKGRRFDILLHMQVALRANVLSRLVKSPVRLGWNKERSRDGHRWFVNHHVANIQFQHQAQAFLEFARAMGIDCTEPVWNLPVTEDDRAWARKHIPGHQPYLVLSPCSSHTLRNWSNDRYAAVADYAIQRHGLRVVLAGGPSELELSTASAIEATMQETPINLVGKDTLTQNMAVLEGAAVLVSPDSGPVHIASALGTPVIGLYAATWARRSGPFNSLDLSVDCFPEAARKFRNKEPEDVRWGARIEVPGVMDLVTVNAVNRKLDNLVTASP